MDEEKKRKRRKRKMRGMIIKTVLWLATAAMLFGGILLGGERETSAALLGASVVSAVLSAGISFWLDAKTYKAEDSDDD